MKKVLILGCPGAGKSTFARKLRDKTGLPLYYLDMIWHKPEEAIAQIKEKEYALRFKGKTAERKEYTGRILAVGISYNSKTKEHECKIEQL